MPENDENQEAAPSAAPDRLHKITTQFTDSNQSNAELEKHRQAAIAELGGHVHIVRNATSAVPMHDDEGLHTGHTYIMTSVWKLAPPEPKLVTPAEEKA